MIYIVHCSGILHRRGSTLSMIHYFKTLFFTYVYDLMSKHHNQCQDELWQQDQMAQPSHSGTPS